MNLPWFEYSLAFGACWLNCITIYKDLSDRNKVCGKKLRMDVRSYALNFVLNLISLGGSSACFCYSVNISAVFYFCFCKKVNICTDVVIRCRLVCYSSADMVQMIAAEKIF